MKWQDLVWGAGILILAYLILTNWAGANALLGSGVKGAIGLTKALQGR